MESSSSQAPGTDTQVFRDTGFPARACPDGDVTIMHLDRVRKGADIRVKVWSDQPNDFEGAVIQIRQRVYWPSVSEREWEKHVAKREAKAWKRAQRRQAGDGHLPVASVEVDTGPKGAPPAPRREVVPPKVSVHAEWVPGYWHWVDTDWLWIAGDWRVPAEDVRYGRTLQARYPPPAARSETIPEAPAAGFLWTPGYWTWNRGRYLWIAGVWRLSPTRGAIWKNHSWRLSGSGAIFVPGGWRD